MDRFFYVVWVDVDTEAHADQVMAERLGCDEDYGFDYEMDWDENKPARKRWLESRGVKA